ncbi:MAG: hypothetical protein HN509_02525 [Halobacteriovoraceae bacterium]|jgi:3-phosphoshikimate 1-carboxyvinyltransferase|nr:hypothetical protein [Halobacteriovoraceae bacterium]MBT5093519.1 hypothetical protein [Halobacteriovoraceae bacterium]
MTSNNSPFSVKASEFDNTLLVPTSKSFANRALIIAAITEGPVLIKNMPRSTDVITMKECLTELGLVIVEDGNNLTVQNSFPDCEEVSTHIINLPSGDGGTTNRFLMPFLARGKNKYHLNAAGHMRNRPMQALTDALQELGVKVKRGEESSDYWYEIQGPYKELTKKIEVESSESTQFATGLMLATADTEIAVVAKNMHNSSSYFAMTEFMISAFKGDPQNNFTVPVDFSSLSYPLAMGLTSIAVHVKNCTAIDTYQADSVFIDIIEEIGGRVDIDGIGLKLRGPEKLKAIDRDCSGFPDLVPTLAYVASQCNGTSLLKNLSVLRHKESDRVAEVMKVLSAFGVEHSYDEKSDDLSITGPMKVSEPVDFEPPADHRIIMMAYLFMRMNKGGSLTNHEHVAKSFPRFFEKMGT